jgi:hypothetical protein
MRRGAARPHRHLSGGAWGAGSVVRGVDLSENYMEGQKMTATQMLTNQKIPTRKRERNRYFRKVFRFSAKRPGWGGLNVIIPGVCAIFHPDDWTKNTRKFPAKYNRAKTCTG